MQAVIGDDGALSFQFTVTERKRIEADDPYAAGVRAGSRQAADDLLKLLDLMDGLPDGMRAVRKWAQKVIEDNKKES